MEKTDTALILDTTAHAMMQLPVVGTGGWLPPEEREGVDWMTLVRLMGWQPKLVHPKDFNLQIISGLTVKWIILAGDPESISSRVWHELMAAVWANPILLIGRAGKAQTPVARYTGIFLTQSVCCGDVLEWQGKACQKNWTCRSAAELPVIEVDTDALVVTRLAGHAVVAARQNGQGRVVLLSFNPSSARDQEGIFTALLKHLLVYESLVPVAWYDWQHSLVLRMDDPGSSEVIYNQGYNTGKLDEREWSVIGEEIRKRQGSMSVGYVSGWVDDGDPGRGELQVNGLPVVRTKGAVHPTPEVRYQSLKNGAAGRLYDFSAEYRSLQKLIDAGLIDAQVHGFTHLHPDRVAWAEAPDRYSNTTWYREFGRHATQYINNHPELEHPLNAGIMAVTGYFKAFPSALICPGDEFTNDVLERALQAGIMLVSSYYLALRIGQQLCWTQHVCAPYLDQPDSVWFDSELPVVGYFHDFDVCLNGTGWFSKYMDEWQAAGAKYLLSLGEVAARMNYYLSVEKEDVWQLRMIAESKRPVKRAVRVHLYNPVGKLPVVVAVRRDGEVYVGEVSDIGNCSGTIDVSNG